MFGVCIIFLEVILVKILLSSANKLDGEIAFSGRSLMWIRNNIGPRTVPWDTPLVV